MEIKTNFNNQKNLLAVQDKNTIMVLLQNFFSYKKFLFLIFFRSGISSKINTYKTTNSLIQQSQISPLKLIQ